MVNKKDATNPAPEAVLPELVKAVSAEDLTAHADYPAYDTVLSGSPHLFEDYQIGEKIDHVDGMTIEEAEHQTATRLYQNTAKVHFNQYEQGKGRFGKRLIYGGVVISTARSLAFNGLANAAQMIAINGGTHTNPLFSGDTIHAWSEVLDKADLSETTGALRLRLVATKDKPCADFPYKGEDGKYLPEVLLDFDYWAAIPKAR
jgi:2-methylfumaryl-CoA hydratase